MLTMATILRTAEQPSLHAMKAPLCRLANATILASIMAFLVLSYCAASPLQSPQGPLPPPTSDAPKQQPQESSSKRTEPGESALPARPAQPNYNPLDSEKDVEVGLFYMHKGDVDAAIPRFEDAIRLRANYAKPRLLLGEAYEKKHDNANAIKYYKEYLQVYPDAPDSKSVQNKVAKLAKK
jgi:tetratricopeptide (TPR) repeat protein